MRWILRLIDEFTTCWVKKRPEAKDRLIEKFEGFNVELGNFGYDTRLTAIGNALPDMVWAKDLEGRYIWANEKLINKLLFSGTLENTIGRKDAEMALARKQAIGADKHTFGEICGNSDFVVIANNDRQRFLEFGLVTGEPMYLEVHKSPLYDKDHNIIGTVGVGRDITTEYLSLQKIHNMLKDVNPDISEISKELEEVMNRYYYNG